MTTEDYLKLILEAKESGIGAALYVVMAYDYDNIIPGIKAIYPNTCIEEQTNTGQILMITKF